MPPQCLSAELEQLLGDPGEIGLGQANLRQRVPDMGIETDGDEEEVGREIVERRQDATFEGVAENFAAVAWLQRRIEDVADAGFAERACTGKERHLMRRAVEQLLIGPERGLRAVAVMHIEIDHGHSLGAVLGARMERSDGDIIEKAEAHGARRLGMVPGGTHRAECVGHISRHDLIDGVERSTCGAERCIPAPRRDHSIRVEPVVIVLRNLGFDHLNIGLRMQTLDVGETGERCFFPLQHLERWRVERIVNRAQAISTLGVTVAGIVFEAGWVGEKQGRHNFSDGWWAAAQKSISARVKV